ncbi:MAG: tetratricopeptide repeat protein [Atopobiaceae bacterium]|nr:tetratricopeptide repeat protein [Atopobiaceae bacterium]MCH4180075.1 tetratricopeptide repeat protein [Atopobiaceae bacterium]MCH4213873.1 tetratricopeptide repeat protein [Atopobiaceae bacterium]MCH4230111.1 tetratricopeptide repeat protein [Atopobiaceae bacterium]MCH4275664.1 tetratricopeptide repeat protein [Atopobiaceae bacterium]
MDQQAYLAAKNAYQQGDMAAAANAARSCKQPGEISGCADHLLGNALMKMGRYAEAADAYGSALEDTSYGKSGALSCNRGRALLAAGQVDGAITALTQASSDASYPTPYKAQMALGKAYTRKGDLRQAGVAFRNAAIDESNPDPSVALMRLGRCFMDLGRPVDAVEAYRTALDFSTPLESQNSIYAELGRAYVAANRMTEAIDAFGHATADGTYQLSPEAAVAFQSAQHAVAAMTGGGPSSTDAMLAAAGYGEGGTGSYDPLDPMGKSGEMMPSPEDTGFFSVSEQELVENDKKDRKKKRHTGRHILIALLVILLLLAAVAGFGYYKGYGWPTQEATVEAMFKANTDSGDIGSYLAGSVTSGTRSDIEAVLPVNATVKVDGVDRSMSSSKVTATATLEAGGTQSYTISLVRDGIGWKVDNVTVDYASQGGTTASLSGTAKTSAATTSTATTTTGTLASATTASSQDAQTTN